MVEVMRVFQKHVDLAIDEAIGVLVGEARKEEWPDDEELGLSEAQINELAELLHADGAEWRRTGEDSGITQRWPDGTVDSYETYVTYQCESGPYGELNLALGTVGSPGKEGEVVGFVLGASGGSRRPLTVFFPADDFDTSGERLSMIRGKGGGNSRKGYAPDEELPAVYMGFQTDVLSQRIAGKWNVQAVVTTDDPDGERAMLNHTAIQARLRGIA